MGEDVRVVLRSPWSAEVLNTTPVAVLFIVITALSGEMASLVTVAAVFVLMTVLFHYLSRTVLTSQGIEMRLLTTTVIAWSKVEAVFVEGNRFTEFRVKVLMPDASARSLPAPRAVFGFGRRPVDQARDVIEQWWLRHEHPEGMSGVPWTEHIPRRDDLWAPPPS